MTSLIGIPCELPHCRTRQMCGQNLTVFDCSFINSLTLCVIELASVCINSAMA